MNTQKEIEKYNCFSQWIQDAEKHFPETGSSVQNEVTWMGQVPCEAVRIKWTLGKKDGNRIQMIVKKKNIKEINTRRKENCKY